MATLRSRVELCIQLVSFKNIDLRCEGLYRVSISVESRDSNGSRQLENAREGVPVDENGVASPFALNFHAVPLESSVEGKTVADSSCLHYPASVSVDEKAVYSSTFLVRYIDETFVCGDEMCFRLDIDTLDPPRALTLKVVLEMAAVKEGVDWSSLEDVIGRGKKWMVDADSLDENFEPKFSTLTQKELTLNHYAKGMHEYVPILFDDAMSSGFGLLEVIVHSGCVGVMYEGGERTPKAITLELYLWKKFLQRSKVAQGVTSTLAIDHTLSDPQYDTVINFLENVRKLVLGPGVCTHNSYKSFRALLHKAALNSSSPLELKGIIDFQVPSLLWDRHASEFAMSMPSYGESPVLRPGKLEENESAVQPTFSGFCRLMHYECTYMYDQVGAEWRDLLERIAGNGMALRNEMKAVWKQRAKDRAGESIVRYMCAPEEMTFVNESSVLKHHSKTAQALRQTAHFSDWEKLPVEDLDMFVDQSCHPIIFEQLYAPFRSSFGRHLDTVESGSRTEKISSRKRRCVHVVILVHGFMGSSWDLRSFRNYLSLLESGCLFLLSRVNEDNTDSSISVLSENLAAEVAQFLESATAKYTVVKISFVGHSLGSIIARAALRHPALHRFRHKLHSFFSLASPHLGTLGSRSYLVRTGMWMIAKWRKSKCLEELALVDSSDHRSSLIYKLSRDDVLRLFANVVLVSGHQDQYVPYHSARIQIPEEMRQDSSLKATVQREMAHNILGDIAPDALTRLDFSFYFDSSPRGIGGNTASDSRLDRLIGRAAHVKVLDSPVLIMTLLLHYHDRFFSIASATDVD